MGKSKQQKTRRLKNKSIVPDDVSRFTFHASRFTLLLMLIAFAVGCGREDKSLQESEELIRSGMHMEAIELLEKMTATDDRHPKAHALLGEAYDALGRYNEAIPRLKKAIALYTAQPENRARVRIRLAKIYVKLGERRTGFNELWKVVRSTSDEAMLREVTGLVADAYTVVQLTHGEKDNYAPTFSPDSSQIAFSSHRLDNGEVYVMDLQGRIRQRVTFTTDFNETSPGFLSNSYYMLYSRKPKVSREYKMTLQSSGSTPIFAGFYIIHMYSRVTREILPVGFGIRAPRVSPDGNQVVYETTTEENLELYTLDLSGMDIETVDPSQIEPKRITHNEVDDGSPAFFPDGKRIAFVSSRGNSRDRVHQIYTINLDGSDERHLNPNPYDCYSPVISPDGKTIAFVSARDEDIEIYIMDVNGTNERRITNEIGVSMQPAFSPDGTKLAFVSDRSDTFQIYLMDLTQPITREALVQRLKGE